MNPDWITWILQFVIVMAVSRVWISLDRNTQSISELREEIPKVYATKLDVDRHNEVDVDHHKSTDLTINILRDRIHDVDVRMSKFRADT